MSTDMMSRDLYSDNLRVDVHLAHMVCSIPLSSVAMPLLTKSVQCPLIASQCCPPGYGCFAGNLCCPGLNVPCSSFSCYDPFTRKCYPNGASCPLGYDCLQGGGCCPTGELRCGSTLNCFASATEICCSSGAVCDKSETCCGNGCCRVSNTCEADGPYRRDKRDASVGATCNLDNPIPFEYYSKPAKTKKGKVAKKENERVRC